MKLWYGIVAFALAGCSALPSGAPMPAQPALAGFAASPAAAKRSDSCKIGGTWHFEGSCRTADFTGAPAVVRLAPYKGLQLTLALPKTSPVTDKLIVEDGTGSGDITGKFMGVAFPDYGKAPCLPIGGYPIQCYGKAFLYAMVMNPDLDTVEFPSIPAGTIASRVGFPGTKQCEADLMEFGDSYDPVEGWTLMPIYGKPAKGHVSFHPVKIALTLATNQFAVLAFTCH
jgi:hypothetical protein